VNRLQRLAIALATLSTSICLAQTTVPTTSPTTQPRRDRYPYQPPMELRDEPQTRNEFKNETLWHDTDGMHINAHGGGVLFHDGLYYWFGENRAMRTREVRWPPSPGVSVYTSTDLYNWKNAGIALATVDDEASDITRGCNIERPKVIYNAKAKKFVMWFHLELKGRGYGAARAAVAVSDSPTGPFTFIRSLRPNAGKWPIDYPEELRTPLDRDGTREFMKDFRKGLVEGGYLRRDFEGGQMSRDMGLFVDDDGKGYLISSAEENYTLNIHELTDDYLDFTGRYSRILPGGHNEAPAILKRDGKYHLLASGCTGWDPNDARHFTTDNILGQWKRVGNPCEGVNPANNMGPNKTWGGQSTAILAVPGKPGTWIAMFDVWRPRNLIESGYIWLPVEFEGEKMIIRWRDSWKLGENGVAVDN
jgi:hypothetical protein